MASYKKCPRCEINWIPIGDEYCPSCLSDLKLKSFGAPKPRFDKPFPQKCKIVNLFDTIEANAHGAKRTGYIIYDQNDEPIGVVDYNGKNDDRAVIRFYNHLENQYGTWHLIKVNGRQLLMNDILIQFEIKEYIEIMVE